MAFEETESSLSLPPEASAIPAVQDPKDQEDNASSKENPEVSKVVEDQTPHQEVEEAAKEDQGQHVDVAEMGAEVGVKNEGEGEITEVEAEAGVGDKAEIKFQPPGSKIEEVGTGHQAEIESEAEAGGGAELDSQANGESGVPAESESEADDVGTAEPDSDEEAEKPRKLTVDDIKTAPMDFRFPTTNQAKHCFTRYVEYHKCVQAKGDDYSDCDKYARYYRSLCPGEWVDRWNEQRENGTFPGPL